MLAKLKLFYLVTMVAYYISLLLLALELLYKLLFPFLLLFLLEFLLKNCFSSF